MTSLNTMNQAMGGHVLPIDASAISTTLAPADPARDALLDFVRTVLNDELGEAWVKASSSARAVFGKDPVADVWPGPPSPEIVTARKCDFPALFLSRDGVAQIDQFTLTRDRITQSWGLHYIMPALDVGQRRQVEDMLSRVLSTTVLALRAMRHKAYQSGAYWMQGVGLSAIFVRTAQAGQARFAEDQASPHYPAMSIMLETWELWRSTDPGVDATGATFKASLSDGSTTIPNLVVGQTEPTYQAP
jgi:hypothetical protein